jgi:hypothetical protein
MAYAQYFAGNFSQTMPNASITDTTPPAGGAINSIANNNDGSILVGWPAAIDSTPPIRYQVFIQQATATDLFLSTNRVYEGPGASISIYRDASALPIISGVTYYAGVRAVDAVGNVNTNTTSLSVTATGISYSNLQSLISGLKGLILIK